MCPGGVSWLCLGTSMSCVLCVLCRCVPCVPLPCPYPSLPRVSNSNLILINLILINLTLFSTNPRPPLEPCTYSRLHLNYFVFYLDKWTNKLPFLSFPSSAAKIRLVHLPMAGSSLQTAHDRFTGDDGMVGVMDAIAEVEPSERDWTVPLRLMTCSFNHTTLHHTRAAAVAGCCRNASRPGLRCRGHPESGHVGRDTHPHALSLTPLCHSLKAHVDDRGQMYCAEQVSSGAALSMRVRIQLRTNCQDDRAIIYNFKLSQLDAERQRVSESEK